MNERGKTRPHRDEKATLNVMREQERDQEERRKEKIVEKETAKSGGRGRDRHRERPWWTDNGRERWKVASPIGNCVQTMERRWGERKPLPSILYKRERERGRESV